MVYKKKGLLRVTCTRMLTLEPFLNTLEKRLYKDIGKFQEFLVSNVFLSPYFCHMIIEIQYWSGSIGQCYIMYIFCLGLKNKALKMTCSECCNPTCVRKFAAVNGKRMKRKYQIELALLSYPCSNVSEAFFKVYRVPSRVVLAVSCISTPMPPQVCRVIPRIVIYFFLSDLRT